MLTTVNFTASTKESNGVKDYFLGHNYYLVRRADPVLDAASPQLSKDELELTKFVMTNEYVSFINNDGEVRLDLSDLQEFYFSIDAFSGGHHASLVKFTKQPHKFLGEVSSLQIFDKNGDDLVNLGITDFLFEKIIDEKTKKIKKSFTLKF